MDMNTLNCLIAQLAFLFSRKNRGSVNLPSVTVNDDIAMAAFERSVKRHAKLAELLAQ